MASVTSEDPSTKILPTAIPEEGDADSVANRADVCSRPALLFSSNVTLTPMTDPQATYPPIARQLKVSDFDVDQRRTKHLGTFVEPILSQAPPKIPWQNQTQHIEPFQFHTEAHFCGVPRWRRHQGFEDTLVQAFL